MFILRSSEASVLNEFMYLSLVKESHYQTYT